LIVWNDCRLGQEGVREDQESIEDTYGGASARIHLGCVIWTVHTLCYMEFCPKDRFDKCFLLRHACCENHVDHPPADDTVGINNHVPDSDTRFCCLLLQGF
jgi:hypothetical protein